MFSTSEWLLRMLQAKLIKIDKLKYPRNEVKNLYFPSEFDILKEIGLSYVFNMGNVNLQKKSYTTGDYYRKTLIN